MNQWKSVCSLSLMMTWKQYLTRQGFFHVSFTSARHAFLWLVETIKWEIYVSLCVRCRKKYSSFFFGISLKCASIIIDLLIILRENMNIIVIFGDINFDSVELMTMNIEQALEHSHNSIGQRLHQPRLFGLNDCFVSIFPLTKKIRNKFKILATDFIKY